MCGELDDCAILRRLGGRVIRHNRLGKTRTHSWQGAASLPARRPPLHSACPRAAIFRHPPLNHTHTSFPFGRAPAARSRKPNSRVLGNRHSRRMGTRILGAAWRLRASERPARRRRDVLHSVAYHEHTSMPRFGEPSRLILRRTPAQNAQDAWRRRRLAFQDAQQAVARAPLDEQQDGGAREGAPLGVWARQAGGQRGPHDVRDAHGQGDRRDQGQRRPEARRGDGGAIEAAAPVARPRHLRGDPRRGRAARGAARDQHGVQASCGPRSRST